MSATGVIFPHQLFEQNPLVTNCATIYLVEEWLYFRQYNFHKQKIAFHRASMKFYENQLKSKGIKVVYIDAHNELADSRKLISQLKASGINSLQYIDTTDEWLEKRIAKAAALCNVQTKKHTTTLFINTPAEIDAYFKDKKRLFQTDFYKSQRLKRNILMDSSQQPLGGKWTYDAENRLKYPKDKLPPTVNFLQPNSFYAQAVAYTQQYFGNNYGELNAQFIYPTTFDESKAWLKEFLAERFSSFGAYEDAIITNEHILHHSVLTPMLNVGLLTPEFVIEETLRFGNENYIPLNSLEGFIRQIIGWREFIRLSIN